MAAYKLLVVEDDTVLRDLYLRKFDKNLFDIRTAVNGVEALKLVEEDPPDLMLLDLNMPILDGFGVLEKLTPEKRTFRIIILTNFDDEKTRERGMSMGVKDFFVKKDMTIKSLLEMAEKAVGEKKA